MFIGSSKEGLHIAEALGRKLAGTADLHLWRDAFQLGETSIESLLRELKRSDYAVLIATHDDLLETRGEALIAAPRDNIVFEAGLFIGSIGRMRTFLLCDVSSKMKLPSDLAGVTFATFDSSLGSLADSLESAANRIRSVLAAGPRGEMDFLRAYLAVIRPEIKVSDTYAQILEGHLGELLSEADRLAREEDWPRLLELKQRLREYFEFSGRYSDGIKMGRAYVTALRRLGQAEETAWARVKHVGYMLILAGEHLAGQREIKAVLTEAEMLPDSVSRARLLFYAYRYLGISYQRDPAGPRIDQARECFVRARGFVDLMAESGASVEELRARILRNIGNAESQEGNHALALTLYRESMALFRQMSDQEHIGITSLAIAQALNRTGEPSKDVLEYLAAAEEIFSRIGWIEGLGRVYEQYALHWKAKSTQVRRPAAREQARKEAVRYGRMARSLFTRIRLQRMEGRVDTLLEELGASAFSSVA